MPPTTGLPGNRDALAGRRRVRRGASGGVAAEEGLAVNVPGVGATTTQECADNGPSADAQLLADMGLCMQTESPRNRLHSG